MHDIEHTEVLEDILIAYPEGTKEAIIALPKELKHSAYAARE